MRIDKGPHAIEPSTSARQKSLHTSIRAERSAHRKTISNATTVDLKSMGSLLQAVGDSTQIREAIVADVKQRFDNGELLSRQTAAETARAILNM